MKERIIALISTGVGGMTTKVSIDNIIADTTPIITWVGLIFGSLLSVVLFIYWARKTFKK